MNTRASMVSQIFYIKGKKTQYNSTYYIPYRSYISKELNGLYTGQSLPRIGARLRSLSCMCLTKKVFIFVPFGLHLFYSFCFSFNTLFYPTLFCNKAVSWALWVIKMAVARSWRCVGAPVGRILLQVRKIV